ncbi:aminotransferase class V-fold PLP-dependent enzyme [Hymenobacter latericus]|uniref:aminotransferase class V-fold PLP-dependent enzyme n=1 Tax=Hymenobacter sp. YIM 151858-1 TaxID=2987688 RepID=UPI0022279F64|nr:aminotransferase class V-fold PLP-dependent enzyme [Hymenobacter sp. YIM 151858-1]UYZ60441.1 aminotransferase class V-fold PLP-dependent enzyme [Hymenobacter sp. YIM 151858-1]
MYTFNPGPSQVYPAVRQYLTAAFDEGWLSAPHRGDRFTALVRQTVTELKTKLNIPQDYFIFFTSSATECWEIIAQSLTERSSFHLYNGSFGEKWLDYARAIRPGSRGHRFELEEVPDAALIPDDAEVVCITQNESSTATQLRDGAVLNLYNRCQQLGALLAVDVTSSLGGIQLKHIKADIWFASVQKCFGLPAGLGLLICSPRAVARARELGEKGHYNSLVSMYEKMLNFQTTHTPNVLNIYLLCRVLLDRAPIKAIDQHLRDRAARLYQFFEENPQFSPLVQNPETRSTTVIAVQAPAALIDETKRRAAAAGLTLGSGYGKWAKSTFRIANFPALPDVAFEQLTQMLAAVQA